MIIFISCQTIIIMDISIATIIILTVAISIKFCFN